MRKAPDRYVYYPGTEELKPDEIRLVAYGTGMPAARRGQAASCWLFELSNGDTFPNTWFTKYATDADVVIHECMNTRVPPQPCRALRRIHCHPKPSRI